MPEAGVFSQQLRSSVWNLSNKDHKSHSHCFAFSSPPICMESPATGTCIHEGQTKSITEEFYKSTLWALGFRGDIH